MTKNARVDAVLDLVGQTRRDFLKRVVGGVAVGVAITSPLMTSVSLAADGGQGRHGEDGGEEAPTTDVKKKGKKDGESTTTPNGSKKLHGEVKTVYDKLPDKAKKTAEPQ